MEIDSHAPEIHPPRICNGHASCSDRARVSSPFVVSDGITGRREPASKSSSESSISHADSLRLPSTQCWQLPEALQSTVSHFVSSLCTANCFASTTSEDLLRYKAFCVGRWVAPLLKLTIRHVFGNLRLGLEKAGIRKSEGCRLAQGERRQRRQRRYTRKMSVRTQTLVQE